MDKTPASIAEESESQSNVSESIPPPPPPVRNPEPSEKQESITSSKISLAKKFINLPGTANPLASSKFLQISKSDHAIGSATLQADFAKTLNKNIQQRTESETHDNDTTQSCVDDVRKIIMSYLNQRINEEKAIERMTLPEVTAVLVNDVLIRDTASTARPVSISNETTVVMNDSPVKPVEVPKPVVEKKSLTKTVTIEPKRGDSLSSFGSNVCRICMTRGRERLVSPCYCKGSMASVHLSCLERWLNQVGRNQCELCGFNYPAIRTPRYTVLQALRLWFGNPRNRSHLQMFLFLDRQSDCLIFWLLSTVTAALLAVCIYGTQYFVVEGNKFSKFDVDPPRSNGRSRSVPGVSRRLTETAMDLFMALVLFGYSVTAYLLWKDHFSMWNRWRRANVNVRLLLSPDASPVPFVPRPRLQV